MEKLNHFWRQLYLKLQNTLPELLVAGIVFAIGVGLAVVCKRATISLFSRYQTRSILQKVLKTEGDQLTWLTKVTSRLIFWTIVFLFATISAEILGVNLIEDWLRAIGRYIPNLLASILILVLGLVFAGLVKDFLQKSLQAAGVYAAATFAMVVHVLVVFVIVLVAINQIGIDIHFLTSILLIFLAALVVCAALSFGLGSAPIVTNILAIFYIRRDLKVGESIQIDNTSGRVVEISAISVHIQTDNGLEIIPASKLNSRGYRIK